MFNKATNLNDPRALFCLGTFYRDAKYGFEQDGQKAAEIYRYGKGGVNPDARKAIELYEKLAELE